MQPTTPPSTGVGVVGIAPTADHQTIDRKQFDTQIGDEVHDYDKAFWRNRDSLAASLHTLNGIWTHLARHAQATGRERVALRETVAMAASARWCTAAAQTRAETRGIQVRGDRPERNPAFVSRLLTGGLDTVWTRFEQPALEAAA